MKKLFACIAALIALAFYVSSCEKDDLCPDGSLTTPSLVVEFYDKTNRSEVLPVDGLKYFAEGRVDTLVPGTASKIRVPLKTDMESTKWGFIWNRPSTTGVRPYLNYLDFKYIVSQAYISRACGYRATFLLNAPTEGEANPVISTVTSPLWISEVEIVDRNVVDEFETAEEDENDVHIKIYF